MNDEPQATQDWSKVDLFEIDDAQLALLDDTIEDFDAGYWPVPSPRPTSGLVRHR